MSGKLKYDLIVSLGGNCMVAHNLRYRNMRPFSLPFDWIYMQNEKPLKYLTKGFKDRFEKLCLFDNLEKVPGNNSHKIIYRDNYSGFLFPNHFERDILDTKEYKKVYKKLRRRVDRLFDVIERNKSILFILASEISFSEKDILDLKTTLSQLYPQKILHFRIMCFNSNNNEEKILEDNIHIHKYTRPQNEYDFTKTNYEWAFLDSIKPTIRMPKNSIKIFSLKLFGYHFRLNFSWR